MSVYHEQFDLLIITNVPSFYKINLYNLIYLHAKIHVVFIGINSRKSLNNNEYQEGINFSYSIINETAIEKRNVLKSSISIIKKVLSYNYRKLILCGWNLFEFKILFFLSPAYKNILELESTIIESKTKGIFGVVKKILLRRISIALPSGKLHTDLLKVLDFKGIIRETNGVGVIYRKPMLCKKKMHNRGNTLRYLYVGRLVPEKNIELLVEVFNKNGLPLTIVGTGFLYDELSIKANNNIKFVGFVKNENLQDIYCSNDVFILPSKRETWGLVIEEAIYYGLPVIISDAVGCQYEMVRKPMTGLIFKSDNIESLVQCIRNIELNYSLYKRNVDGFDFYQKYKEQVDSYLYALKYSSKKL